MQFLNPLACWLLLLLLPIALFYILRTKAKKQTVATILFWQQVFEERRSRAFWRRLRHLFSLLLSLFLAALLIGAVFDPVGQLERSERIVVIFDNSASMNAIDASGKSRFDEAKSVLRRQVQSLDGRRQMAILTAGKTPETVSGFSSHLGTLRNAVDKISPSDSSDTISEAIKTAEFLLQSDGDDKSQIVVITDVNARIAEEPASRDNINVVRIGKPAGNLAITKFQPRRSMTETLSFDILLETANFSDVPVECQVEITLNGDVIDVVPFSLDPGNKASQIVTAATASGGELLATLELPAETEDALAVDNTARAILPSRDTQKILFYGDEDFFLVRVLASQLHVELSRITELPETVPANSVLVIHRTIPETLPGGNVFVIDPQNGCDDFTVGDSLDLPVIEYSGSDSPLLQSLRLENTIFHGAKTINFPQAVGLNVLLETPDKEPIYISREIGGQKLLLLTTDIARSELALRTAFPIMFAHALAWFRSDTGEWERASTIAESESDLRFSTLSTVSVDAAPEEALLGSPISTRPIWFWLALAALVFIALEWHLYQRRWID